MAAVYRFWVSLLALAVLVQIGLAGVGAFHAASKLDKDTKTMTGKSFSHWFGPHIALGYLIFLGTIVLLLISLIGYRARWKRSGLIVLLLVAQILFAWFGGAANGALGFLHPLNALLIAAVVGRTAYEEWRPAAETTTVAPATSPAV